MKVILREDVVGLGDIGETVKVRPGYARNFLIPRGMAFETESGSARTIAHMMLQIEAKKRRMKGAAADLSQRVRNTTVELSLRVGTGGKVFGSVSAREIAEKLSEAGIEVDRRRIVLPEAIRKVGTHFVRVKLHADVESQLKVVIKAVAATKAEEEVETAEARAVIEEAAEERQEDSSSE